MSIWTELPNPSYLLGSGDGVGVSGVVVVYISIYFHFSGDVSTELDCKSPWNGSVDCATCEGHTLLIEDCDIAYYYSYYSYYLTTTICHDSHRTKSLFLETRIILHPSVTSIFLEFARGKTKGK